MPPLRPHSPHRLSQSNRHRSDGADLLGSGLAFSHVKHATQSPPMPALPASAPTARIETRTRLKSSWLREAEPDFERRWPREESNLRARIRSPSLYPLSYGAVQRSVATVL